VVFLPNLKPQNGHADDVDDQKQFSYGQKSQNALLKERETPPSNFGRQI
jgi:hypothetical protein